MKHNPAQIILVLAMAVCSVAARPLVLPNGRSTSPAPITFTPSDGGILKPQQGSGLRDVSLAIDSISGLRTQVREALKKEAAAILARFGPLGRQKKRVVFTQTRRYLLAHYAQVRGGGAKGARFLEQFFEVDFGNYVRLPELKPGQRGRAQLIFHQGYIAVGKYISQTYTDTPPSVRKRLIQAVGINMEKAFKSACDYYNLQLLYPNASVPRVKVIVQALAKDPFAYLNPIAFANAAAMLKAKGVSAKTRHDVVSQFIWSQAVEQGATVRNILQQYFKSGGAPAAKAYRPYPQNLVRKWMLFGQRQKKRAEREYRDAINPAANRSLFPTGKQILRGSGVHL